MMEGKEKANLCAKSIGWLQQEDKNAEPWLWKLSNCFSTVDQALPNTGDKQKSYKNNRPAMELKDVPPPPAPPLQSCTNIFPLSKIQPPSVKQIQLQTGPKVSCCALCSNGTSGTPDVHFSGGSGYIRPTPMLDQTTAGTITCQIAPGLPFVSKNPFKKDATIGSCSNYPPSCSNVCMEKRLSPCQFHPSHPVPCFTNVNLNPLHNDLHKLQVSTFGNSSGYYPYSDFTNGVTHHLKEHLAQSEILSHFCTGSLHLNSAPSMFLKGSSFCEACLEKPPVNSVNDGPKMWPNIPPPSTQTATVPLCNGCGTQGNAKAMTIMRAKNFCKATQKCGVTEMSSAGQVQENLPPIGVFWDIENCSVPSGRSAVTVVKRIRERFFKGHREAEFICVCDISKENKEVIEELNNCQVTVAHINATAKNAADDKLRQSLRRFADTHTSPATVVLVSTDVNFALELSDLRHRHGFHIILVHKNQASEALLHHAHELIRFEEFISELPPRLTIKPQQCHTLLYVYNLPTNKDAKSINNRLRRLSDNCGGKVMSISGSSAILRFINQESAERAQKRMENEDVFGNRITVSFSPKNRDVTEAKNSICSIGDKSKSPKKANKNTKLCLIAKDQEAAQNAKGSASKATYSSGGKNSNVKSLQELCQIQSKASSKLHQYPEDKEKKKNGDRLNSTACSSNPCVSSQVSVTTKSAGTEDLFKSGKKREDTNGITCISMDFSKKEEAFQMSNPSAFSKLADTRQPSPVCLTDWSSRSLSPNLSNPSSLPASDETDASDSSGDPFANGADIQIGNLDYRRSRKELLQTLRDVFSRYGKVVKKK